MKPVAYGSGLSLDTVASSVAPVGGSVGNRPDFSGGEIMTIRINCEGVPLDCEYDENMNVKSVHTAHGDDVTPILLGADWDDIVALVEEAHDAEYESICGACNGSGEGMHNGSTCRSCKGSGVSRA